MNRTSICLIPVLALLLSGRLTAQGNDPWFSERIGADGIRSDFELLERSLHAYHGGLFLYTDSVRFSDELKSAMLPLLAGASRAEAYAAMARVIDQVHDGHTWIFPGEDDAKRLMQNERFIPFTVRVAGSSMFVDSSYSADVRIPSGARLTAINGTPIRSIVADLLPYFTSDGHSLSGKLGGLESQFWWYYGLHFGFSERFQVSYELGGRAHMAKVNALSMNQLQERHPAENDSREAVTWKVERGVAYLRVASFNGYKLHRYRKRFQKALDYFHEAGCQELIIDLRGNGGGREGVENLLISCLGHQCTDKYDKVVIRHPVAGDYRYIDKPLRRRIEDLVFRVFEFRRDDHGAWHRRERFRRSFFDPDHPFTGQTSVLVDRNTFSGAAEFAALVRDQIPGVLIVGEETCGGYQGHVSGYSYELRLPNTGFKVHIPRVHFDLNVSGGYTGGVQPHIHLSDPGVALDQLLDEVVYLHQRYWESTASE